MADRREGRWIEYLPLTELRPNPANPKTHRLDVLRESTARFGFTESVVVDDRTGLLVSGHGRRELLLDEFASGAEPPEGVRVAGDGGWLVPVTRGWSSRDDTEAYAALVAANRIGELGGWQQDLLAVGLEQLAGLDEGMVGVGYTPDDLAALLADLAPPADPPVVLSNPDDVPVPPATPITRRGDLWLLGPHRLLCGDATSEADHVAALGGLTVDVVVTDPPYGVGVDYGLLVDDSADAIRGLIAGFMPLVLAYGLVLLTSGHWMMWDYPRPEWVLAWVHPAGSSSGPWGFVTVNPVLAYGKDPYLQRGLGRRADSLVLAADRENEGGGHPVAKPMKVWEWLIERGSPAEGEVVFDPFLGSGTTLIASHRLARRCVGIELEPRWVDVALRRYQAHTGELPVLASTGEPVDFLADEAARSASGGARVG